MSALVEVVRRGPIATITLRSSANRNALGLALLAELDRGVSELAADPEVRVVVLQGSDGVFSSGGDRNLADEDVAAATDLLVHVLVTMRRAPQPYIAVLEGPAVGGGVALVAACDLVLATPDAWLGLPEVRMGLVPDVALALCAPRIGRMAATRLALMAGRLEAREALAAGLVSDVVVRPELPAAVDEIVDGLLLAGPEALAATKSVLDRLFGTDIGELLDAVAR